jgi:hypothetical protein
MAPGLPSRHVRGSFYPEIFNDPVLTQVAALQLDQLRRYPQWQASRSDLDQYREACNAVRQRAGRCRRTEWQRSYIVV